MPLPIIANTCRVAVNGKCANGEGWTNVMHTRFTGGGAPTAAQQQTMLSEVAKLYVGPIYAGGGFLRTYMPAASTIDDARSTLLDGASATQVLQIALAGLDANQALPSGVALCNTLRTNNRGRSYRGRVYLGPFCTDFNAAGGLANATAVNLLNTQFNGLRAALTGITWELVVASYRLTLATTVASITTNTTWDTQRRRQS